MPNARTHDLITLATGVALVPLTYSTLAGYGLSYDQSIDATIALVGAHVLSGIMFSPDLDLDSEIDNRWGVFFWIWRPYMRVVPHRHAWSHGLIFPPLLRLFYFYLIVIGSLIGAAWLLAQVGIVLPDLPERLTDALLGVMRQRPVETAAFLVGFITGGAAHSIADWLVTGGKRYLRSIGLRVTRDYRDHDRYRYR